MTNQIHSQLPQYPSRAESQQFDALEGSPLQFLSAIDLRNVQISARCNPNLTTIFNLRPEAEVDIANRLNTLRAEDILQSTNVDKPFSRIMHELMPSQEGFPDLFEQGQRLLNDTASVLEKKIALCYFDSVLSGGTDFSNGRGPGIAFNSLELIKPKLNEGVEPHDVVRLMIELPVPGMTRQVGVGKYNRLMPFIRQNQDFRTGDSSSPSLQDYLNAPLVSQAQKSEALRRLAVVEKEVDFKHPRRPTEENTLLVEILSSEQLEAWMIANPSPEKLIAEDNIAFLLGDNVPLELRDETD